MSKKLYLDNEYIRDVNSKFNYVSLINDSSYIHNVSTINNSDIDTNNDGVEDLPSSCIYDDTHKYKYKYANDGTNIYHPVRRIGTNWYKLILFGNINVSSDTNSSSLENN